MRYALMTEPQQGLSYDDIAAVATTAERVGFEAFFRSDHYGSFPGDRGMPTTDAWATLGGLARETSTINLGVLVSPVTFRSPGNMAKVVATVAEMAGGRVELGLGAGWNEPEHREHGLPFPEIKQRFDMLEEQLAIVHGLWTEPDGWSYAGAHWTVDEALFHPKPPASGDRRHPNLILGGAGGPRLTRLAATYADELNISSADPAMVGAAYGRLADACRAIGREPGDVTRSAMTGCLIANTEERLRARVRELLVVIGGRDDPNEWLAERQHRWVIGTPDQARRRVDEFAAAGVERLMLQDFLPRDLSMVEEAAEIFLG
ncbi:MAG TPA: TIGR03560 family F420-dependent LLM class oxidoreductase [Candidatus Limnocylindrales bacterium]|nr:TIGR03560 family F420-dependent LLM class oxidoreductase [Candidatus Limnocylindrales bacterium]